MNMNIEKHFQLPIYYNSQKKQVNPTIINDLELIETVDSSSNPIYSHFFNLNVEKQNEFTDEVMKQASEYYTTDIDFLKDNQQLLKNINIPISKEKEGKYKCDYNYDSIYEIWKEIKQDTGFKEKYYYIDWPMWEFLNKSETFLQCMSMYNMASPVISLLLPIIILIIPFFVIQLKGLNLSITEYIEVLKIIVSQHALGKLFSEFNDVSLNQKFYLLISAAFYVFSIYQNILLCIRFHQNMTKIHGYFSEIDTYLGYTMERMNHYLNYTNELKTETHKEFNQLLKDKIEVLNNLKKKIQYISEYKLSFKKMMEIGNILKYFYEIYDSDIYEDVFLYSFGFHGYMDCLEGLKENIRENKIHYIDFYKNQEKEKGKEKEKGNEKEKGKGKKKKQVTILKKNYYASLKDQNPIKNTVSLDKNLIITGPNASGKTTVLKATLINILLSQQFGCGFYSKGSILNPFHYIHCYLNIPDTSGRDSLFQAEARRCKEIIDFIDNGKKEEKHFCVFDELYSGTNPEEAESSAISFMNYLIKNKNVSTILTTHYTNVCTTLESNKNIANLNMNVFYNLNGNNTFQYTYILSKGISKVRGGIKVLTDLNYPEEILEKIIR